MKTITERTIELEKQNTLYRGLLVECGRDLQQAREKLQIECGGSREYKGGCPTQVLFPRMDKTLTKLQKEGIV